MNSKRSFNSIETASNEEMKDILLLIMKWFIKRGRGCPFNYNRGIEFLQAGLFGFQLTSVGGGSDGVNEQGVTAEFKATDYRGSHLSHAFSYNGTTRKETLSEQEEYCRQKIMRDDFHYWSIIDKANGKFIKTYKIPAKTVWDLVWPRWEESFWKTTLADTRIGGKVSTHKLENLKGPNAGCFEVIIHPDTNID